MRTFSALRCFLSNDATDPSICRGYLNAAVAFTGLEIQVERLPMHELLRSLPPLLQNKEDHVISHSLKILMENLSLKLYVSVTVDRNLVFSSNVVDTDKYIRDIITKDVLLNVKKLAGGKYQELDDSGGAPGIIIVKGLLMRCRQDGESHNKSLIRTETLTSSDEESHLFGLKDTDIWDCNFDIYHPESTIGIHLMSYDSTSSNIMDEILESQFIQAKKLQKLPAEAKIDLPFTFEVPYLPMSSNSDVAGMNMSRRAQVILSLKITPTYASVFKAFPGWACNRPPLFATEFYRLGPGQKVRLLGAEIATATKNTPKESSPTSCITNVSQATEDARRRSWCGGMKKYQIDEFSCWEEKKEDLDLALRHAQLFVDICRLWGSRFVKVIQSVVAWEDPLKTFLCLLGTLLLVIPHLQYSLSFLYLAIFLVFCRGFSDPLYLRIVNLRSVIRPPIHEASFQTSKAATEGETAPPRNTATSHLLKCLIESALPPEIGELKEFLRIRLISWLPSLVLFHCILSWSSKVFPMRLAWETRHILEHPLLEVTDVNNKGATDAVKRLGFRTDPYFHTEEVFEARLWRTWLSLVINPTMLFCTCVILSVISAAFTLEFGRIMMWINLTWFTFILTRDSPVVHVLGRFFTAFTAQ